MDLVCKNCESKDFTLENCERICTNCGDVQDELADEGRLCMLPDNEAVIDNFRNKNYDANERLTGRIRGETNSADAKRQVCREKLLDDMRRIVKQLIKHPSAVDETMDLINSTLQAYQGRLLHSKKLGLVGACIYYLSAKHQLGISLTDISKVINVKMKVINICLKQVRQLCPKFEYERPNIKDLVKKHIDQMATKYYDLSSIDVTSPIKGQSSSGGTNSSNGDSHLEPQPLIDNKDRVVLQNRVMLLIELFEAMHPYNQPTPQSLITAVIYHAWRSLDTFKMIALNLSSSISASIPGHGNSSDEQSALELSDEQQLRRRAIKVKHSISFEKFCQICDLKRSSSGYKIVSKLQSSMLMLGRHLGDVNKINLPWYLKDIIENSPHLIQEHMRTELKPKNKSTEDSNQQSDPQIP